MMPFMLNCGTVSTTVLSSQYFVFVVHSQSLCYFSHVDNVHQLMLCRAHCSLHCVQQGELRS